MAQFMKLNDIFRDGVVFAEEKPVRIFGEGDGTVTVRLCGAEATSVSERGRWIAELPAMRAGGPFTLEVFGDGVRAEVRDVYVGRVYLVAGQSNAEFRLSSSSEPLSNYEDDALLRNYFVPRPWYGDDPFSPGEGWQAAKRSAVGDWSAIAYLAGKTTRSLTGKAVGVVTCAQGASVIESWLPSHAAAEFAIRKDGLMADHFDPEYSEWNRDGVIYDKMLSKLFPFSLNGVIWYQGESDTSVEEGKIYADELLRFMKEARVGFADSALPFAVIQIADYDGRRENDPEGWRAIQSAQSLAAERDPYAALVTSRDVCESSCIHPTRKGELSACAAKALL